MKKEDIEKLDQGIKQLEKLKYSKNKNLLCIILGFLVASVGFFMLNFFHLPELFILISTFICIIGGFILGMFLEERTWENFIKEYPWLILDSDAFKSILDFEKTGEMKEQSEKLYVLYKKLDEYFNRVR